MIFELRRYSVLPGRMPDMHARMRDMLLPMFAEHGVPTPIAIWSGSSSWGGDIMSWVVPWESFDARAAVWARFRPLFYAAREAQGGDEFVSRTDLTLIQPWTAMPFGVPAGEGMCETFWHVRPRIPLSGAFLEQSLASGFDAIRAAGAVAVAASDFLFGALPIVVVLASWPEAATRATGMASLETSLNARYAEGLIDDSRWEVLDRVPYLAAWQHLLT